MARLNMSHGDHESHKAVIDMIKRYNTTAGSPIAMMLDTKVRHELRCVVNSLQLRAYNGQLKMWFEGSGGCWLGQFIFVFVSYSRYLEKAYALKAHGHVRRKKVFS